MRAAAIVSAAVVAVGVYLAVSAMLSASTSWMALGVLVIAIVAALSVMAGERPASIHRDRWA